jgi:hypothetical protein
MEQSSEHSNFDCKSTEATKANQLLLLQYLKFQLMLNLEINFIIIILTVALTSVLWIPEKVCCNLLSISIDKLKVQIHRFEV